MFHILADCKNGNLFTIFCNEVFMDIEHENKKTKDRDLTVLLFQLCHHVSADGDGDGAGDGELGSVRGASACFCPVAAGESTPLSVSSHCPHNEPWSFRSRAETAGRAYSPTTKGVSDAFHHLKAWSRQEVLIDCTGGSRGHTAAFVFIYPSG